SVIVNAANPLSKLTVGQVGALFAGRTRDWKTYGGQGAAVCYGRQSSSGTYSFFRQAVVRGEYASDVRQMNGNGQIVEAVARDPGGIGYVAVGYLKSGAAGIRALPIAPTKKDEGVSPLDDKAVAAGAYPIARPLYQFTNGAPTGAVREFLLYELSEAGEAIVTEMGFYPVVESWKERNAHLYGAPA
ncbi:MAG: substrate-binding domain-containing protein, partial [Myxococcota bacterium]